MAYRQFEPKRALEIISPKYGSAYRIGGRLVLTAKHLLFDAGTKCKVRSKQTIGEVEANVVWIDQQADVALIELPEYITPCQPVPFGKLPATKRGEKIDFQMYGWPKWAQTIRNFDTLLAGGRQIEGVIYLADSSPDGLLILEPHRLPPELLTSSGFEWENVSSQWGGISGAAVVCDGLLVAVQRQHQNPKRPASLEAELLTMVYGDSRWNALLSQHGINPEPKLLRVRKTKVTRREVLRDILYVSAGYIIGRNFLLAGAEDRGTRQKRYNALPNSRLHPDSRINGQLRELFEIQLRDQRTVLVPNSENRALLDIYGAWQPSYTTKRVVADTASALSFPNARIEQVYDPIQYNAGASHLFAFGFETSQPIYRRVAGYIQLDSKRSEIQGYEKEASKNPFDLPWKSNLGSSATDDPSEFYLRFIEETGEHVPRRIWSLSHKGTVLRPEFSEAKCIVDYVSIVHIPNFLAPSYEYTMTLIAGIQAARTEAVSKLLTNSFLLEQIQRNVPGASPWQAIIRTDVSDRIKPKFSLIDVSPVGVEMPILDRWRRSPPSF